MKRLMITTDKQTRLLSDQINNQIVRKLVYDDLSVSELSKLTKTSVVKVWRRVQGLKKEGLVEQTASKRIANLEKKMFRATAVRYLPPRAPEFRSDYLTLSQQKFAKIRTEYLRIAQEMNEIPKDMNPIDYAVAVDLYATSKIYTNSKIQQELREILEEVNASGILKLSADLP